MHSLRVICFAILSVVFLHNTVFAEKHVALVIGNDAYENVTPLQKATNDAGAIAETLSTLGFEVIVSKDATRREMNRRLQEFPALVSPGDVALFYYAGHAIEIAGENFLLPTDIPGAAPGKRPLSSPKPLVCIALRAPSPDPSVGVVGWVKTHVPRRNETGGKRGFSPTLHKPLPRCACLPVLA